MTAKPESGCGDAPRRRHGPGADPGKRAKILEGARAVISRVGYDAASVSDIAREAGVSKGTIYVYFGGKEDLFVAMISQQRDAMFREYERMVEGPGDLVDKMYRLGCSMTRTLCSDRVIRAHRVIIGVTERMPEIGREFHDKGARRAEKLLVRLLEPECAAGRLDIPDLDLAAAQFFQLSMAGLFRARLLGRRPEPPDEDEIKHIVREAVAMFLARYAVPARTG